MSKGQQTKVTPRAPQSQDAPKPKRDKREAFVRLATKRTRACLKRMRQIRALANRSAYDYTDEEVAAIMTALSEGLVSIEKAFERRQVIEQEFKL